ncbi:transposase, partial [Streptomyces sp. NPDC126514]|uniref:transposase n=1 Tax=Streptomyces sp. NPDC126514 TaxID=3155210 RepID=UPI00332459E5
PPYGIRQQTHPHGLRLGQCTLVGAHDQTKAAPASGESPGERLSSRHRSRPEEKEQAKSVGVARQYTGVTGQVENAQVSVYLTYGSPRGRAIIDREMCLGRHWAGSGEEHHARCREAQVPEDRAGQVVTEPELARRMVERTLTAGVPFSYFLTDEAYGASRSLRAWLEEHQVRYVMAIPKNEMLPLPDGRTQEARLLWARVPETAMERSACADGAKGPREYDFSAVRLADTPCRAGTHSAHPALHNPEQEEQTGRTRPRSGLLPVPPCPRRHTGRPRRRRWPTLDDRGDLPGREERGRL